VDDGNAEKAAIPARLGERAKLIQSSRSAGAWVALGLLYSGRVFVLARLMQRFGGSAVVGGVLG